MRCLCPCHPWEPSLAHSISPAMPWHRLGPCWWPGPQCCQGLCPPSDSAEDGKPVGKAVSWLGLFTGGDGPVIPSCNPFLQSQPQKTPRSEHSQQAHARPNIFPWYIHRGGGVYTGQLCPSTFRKSAPCSYCLTSNSACTLDMSKPEEMSPKPSPAKAF